MFKVRLLGVTLMAAVLATSAIAQAATKRHVSQTVKLAAIFQGATYPNPGSKALNAGTLSGRPASGAVLQRITITGHPTATTYTFKGMATDYYRHGTTRTSLRGVATVQPSGALTVIGHGRYTGGTNTYRGARGRFSFAGGAPPAMPGRPGPLVVHLTGTIRY